MHSYDWQILYMSCHCVHCTGVYAPHKDLLFSIPLLVTTVKTSSASQTHKLVLFLLGYSMLLCGSLLWQKSAWIWRFRIQSLEFRQGSIQTTKSDKLKQLEQGTCLLRALSLLRLISTLSPVLWTVTLSCLKIRDDTI